jgi:hypothetical protein
VPGGRHGRNSTVYCIDHGRLDPRSPRRRLRRVATRLAAENLPQGARPRPPGFPKEVPMEDLHAFFTLTGRDRHERPREPPRRRPLPVRGQRYLGFCPEDLGMVPGNVRRDTWANSWASSRRRSPATPSVGKRGTSTSGGPTPTSATAGRTPPTSETCSGGSSRGRSSTTPPVVEIGRGEAQTGEARRLARGDGWRGPMIY